LTIQDFYNLNRIPSDVMMLEFVLLSIFLCKRVVMTGFSSRIRVNWYVMMTRPRIREITDKLHTVAEFLIFNKKAQIVSGFSSGDVVWSYNNTTTVGIYVKPSY
jgi:hypothetical protein